MFKHNVQYAETIINTIVSTFIIKELTKVY